MKREPAADAWVRATLRSLSSLPWEAQLKPIRELGRRGDVTARSALLTLMESRNSDFRRLALEALWEAGGSTARPAARSAVWDPDSLVRDVAGQALGDLGRARDVPLLAHLLRNDPDWTVRSSAADSLGYLRYPRAQPVLRAAIAGDRHPVVRRDAAQALGRLRDPASVTFLQDQLRRTSHPQARLGLWTALYLLGEPAALDALLELLQCEDDDVRQATVNALRVFTHPAHCSRVLGALAGLIASEPNPDVRTDAERTRQRLTEIVPTS